MICVSSVEENVKRTLGNLSKIPSWNSVLNKEEVDYLFRVHSDSVFCNGKLRQIKVEAITNDVFKIYTILHE